MSSRSVLLLRSLALTLLYSDLELSATLDVMTALPAQTSLLGSGWSSHSRRQIASTNLLLAGKDAGHPADRKHLKWNEVQCT